MVPFHSRERVTSRLRLRGHDYSSSSTYFITICTERRLPLFGDIRGGSLNLSPAGAMVDSWWQFIPAQYPSVQLDSMVVMPNHLHALLHIGTDPDVVTPPTLSVIMHWFKVRTTYDYTIGVNDYGWQRFPGRLWQEQYYDHIVRNQRSLERIRMYIEDNPARWHEDEYNTGS